jgi:protein disulfide-isomerase
MRKLLLGVLALLSTLAIGAVNTGDTLESVIAEKGQPVSKLGRGDITVLTYSDAVIRIEGGKVVSIKPPSADYATRAVAPKPQPTRSPSRAPAAAPGEWTTDYEAALATASGSNRKILLFFTGSDWCGPCKRLDGEILGTVEFLDYARENLVLVKLDFPKHMEQSDQLKAQNAQLAERYKIRGYPTVVVLNSSGEPLGTIGYMRGGPGPFISKLKQY